MFSNRQQNSSNLMHQTITSSGSIILPPPPPAISISSIPVHCNNTLVVTSVATTILALDGLNCGGIPTRTTPTLTPTTLRNIAADIASLSPGPTEDFAAAAASDLHHLVLTPINTSSGPTDRLSSDLQERHNIQNLGVQSINLQNLNNQQININNFQNHHHLNQNSLNQQQRNDYNNSFSSAASRQAGFVPPLVLQISSSNTNTQQPPVGTTTLLNSSANSGSSTVFSAKGSSTSASSSHWQGAVVTETPLHHSRSLRRRFTDDEDIDEDFDSAADDGTDSSDTTSGKMLCKEITKGNKSNSKTIIKNEFKNTANTTNSTSGRRTNNKDKAMSVEEEQRRQIRRERNKLAAARCRKRRMDHTNELLEETEQLEDKRSRLKVEIQSLRKQKSDLQLMLSQHKCAVTMNNGAVSNSVPSVNNASIMLNSNDIPGSDTSDTNVLSNKLTVTKGNPTPQQNISTIIVKNENSCNNVSDILIKCEGDVIQADEENKDNLVVIPNTVLQQPHRRRPTTLLQLNNSNFGSGKKISGNASTGVVVLNFDSLMDGGTGLTPVSTSGSSVQNHHQQIQHGSTESNSK